MIIIIVIIIIIILIIIIMIIIIIIIIMIMLNFGRLVYWPTVNAPYGGSAFARITLGDSDSGLEGAESARRDETPWSIYERPLATA